MKKFIKRTAIFSLIALFGWTVLHTLASFHFYHGDYEVRINQWSSYVVLNAKERARIEASIKANREELSRVTADE